MTQTVNYRQMGTAARGQAHALFSQTMAYVAGTAACSRSAPTWAAISPAAWASSRLRTPPSPCLIGMQFAAPPSVQLTVGLLAAFGLLIGLAV